MAIEENDGIHSFGGFINLASAVGAVAADAFSISSDLAQWTNTDDAPFAAFILSSGFVTATGVAGKRINLFTRHIDVDLTTGAVSTNAPSTSNRAGYLGYFQAPESVTAVRNMAVVGLPIALPNAMTQQKYEFYVENKTGQSMAVNWSLHIKPMTVGPHPA